MSEETSNKGRARGPIGLLGAIAIVVAGECYVASRDTDLGTMFSIEWRTTGDAVARRAPGADVVCLGTSVTRMGVSPRVLEERLGLRAYNFAISGGQPFASYTMLKHVLATGARPKAIVVDFKWSAIGMDHTWNERVLPEMATLLECAELARAAGDASFFGRLALVAMMPSYRCRAEIRANVLAAVDGKEPVRNQSRKVMLRNARVNHGGILVPVRGVKQEFNPDDPHIFPKDWSVHPISAAYIEMFLRLAESESIPVYWLIAPVGPGTLARREAIGAEARYTRFVWGATAAHPGVTVVDGRFSDYAPEAFTDTTHLNLDGSIALSDDLADAMKERLGPSPATNPSLWVKLPRYRARPEAGRHEDLADSHLVVTELSKRRVRR